jgi:hypothetical protein
MSKAVRVGLVLVALVAIVAIGMSGTVWADKLGASSQIQAKEGGKIYSQSRPLGTVKGGSIVVPVIPVTGGCTPPVASVGKLSVTIPCDMTGQALTELPSSISAPTGKTIVPGTLATLQLASGGTGNTTSVIVFAYPGLASGQTIAYWNGTAWVTLTAGANGEYTIPAGTPTPVYVAAFSA